MDPDLDAYIATRTAPNQNYCNPAECVMSMLNLGLQNLATARESMESTKEIRMRSLGTLKKIREAAQRDPSLRENLEASIKPVLDLICNRFSQLKYSGNPIQTEAPADQDDWESSFVDLFSSIFPAEDEVVKQSFTYISEGTITTLQVLKDFMAKHCDAKCYSFQIQKCTEETYAYCSINPLQMPNEVFNSLHFFAISLTGSKLTKVETISSDLW